MRVTVPEDKQTDAYGYVMSTYAKKITGSATQFSQSAFVNSTLSFREFEAARRRTAEINGCVLCQNFRPDKQLLSYLEYGNNRAQTTVASRGSAPNEAFYQAVYQWRSSTIFSEREQLAIEYAEKIGADPQSLSNDDEFWKRIKAQYSDDEIVDLSCCLAGWIGLGRLTHVLGLDANCSL